MQNTHANICVTVTHTWHSYAHIHSAIDGTSYKSLSVVCKNQRLNFLKFINLLKVEKHSMKSIKEVEIQHKIGN